MLDREYSTIVITSSFRRPFVWTELTERVYRTGIIIALIRRTTPLSLSLSLSLSIAEGERPKWRELASDPRFFL